ncbi:MAG: 2-oxoacid:acceptor oxidoreductase subunit alpha [Dehalococcoidia bacterium]|nr:2-oxoacid:acceptor oxidoreductase subunit alpha [Dehalococcoidia bacterium]
MAVDINIMVGGEAGQGVQAAGFIIAKALARYGLSVFADQDYESRVRGGHNFFRIRAGDGKVGAISEEVDILLALDQLSVDLHKGEVSSDGVIIFDSDKTNVGPGKRALGLPLERTAIETAKNKQSANTVALGAAMAVIGYDVAALKSVVLDYFGTGESGPANADAAARGYEASRAGSRWGIAKQASPASAQKRMMLNGNEAIAVGALAAGCKFVSAYPMTPSTTIMEYMAGKADELGIVVVQPEDEISAINMIIGAAYAGVRSMTATSGGGFCLMVEGLGLAGMTETPIVVLNAQRAGPAIGLPTRTEQGDLLFALHASHGDFPRVVLAPANVEDAFWLTVKAFNLADEYQVPVIVLTDQYLASSYATAEGFDLSKVQIKRGQLLSEGDPSKPEHYKRYEITASGISPRAFPMQSAAPVVADSDEHNEEGHMIEDAETRAAMMMKRQRKLEGLKKEISGPRTHGPPQADITLVGWGSTLGALREVVDTAAQHGLSVNLVHFAEIWPFPTEAANMALRGARRTFAVEGNPTAQFARVLRTEMGHQVSGAILKFDGRPLTPAYILAQLRKEVA